MYLSAFIILLLPPPPLFFLTLCKFQIKGLSAGRPIKYPEQSHPAWLTHSVMTRDVVIKTWLQFMSFPNETCNEQAQTLLASWQTKDQIKHES